MRLYHGSNKRGIEVLEPQQADHDRPYIYLTTMEVVAAFYLCNAVQRPYYWFPYGFTEEGIPVYHELYPNALREVSEGVTGALYEVEAGESQVIPFPNIPCARLGTRPLRVTGYRTVENAWELFLEFIRLGRLCVGRYEDKSEKELQNWYGMIRQILKEKDMKGNPECSYARFVKERFPWIWEEYIFETLGEKHYEDSCD